MKELQRGWKSAAVFGLAGMILAMVASPASAGWRRDRVVVVAPTVYAAPAPVVYAAPAPVAAVYSAPVVAAPVVPAATVFDAVPAAYTTTTSTVVSAPVPTTYVAPAAVVAPLRPVRVVYPRRVFRYPY